MSTTFRTTILLALAAVIVGAPLASAATAAQDALQAQAKVTETDARTTALAKVSNGTVRSSSLEKEHGKLVWSFDIAQPSTGDLTEVQVDAKTGAIASVKKETPAQEAREAKRHD